MFLDIDRLRGMEDRMPGIFPTDVSEDVQQNFAAQMETPMIERSISRRQLFPALASGIAVGVTFLLAPRKYAQAQPKVSQADAKYQDHPNNGAKCSACRYFQPPDSCQLVAGSISSDGWCSFYVSKG